MRFLEKFGLNCIVIMLFTWGSGIVHVVITVDKFTWSGSSFTDKVLLFAIIFVWTGFIIEFFKNTYTRIKGNPDD